RGAQGQDLGRAAHDGGAAVGLLGRAAGLAAVAAEQADDAGVNGQLGGLDVLALEDDLEALLQVEVHGGDAGAARRAEGDGDAGHGDDDGVRRRLLYVDVARAGVRAALAVRVDVAVTVVEGKVHRRRGRRVGGDGDGRGLAGRHGDGRPRGLGR